MTDTEPLTIVGRCALLRDLSADECAAVLRDGRQKHAPQGSFFFHQGDDSLFLYIISHGHVRLTQTTVEGAQIIVNYFGPGDGLGIVVALMGIPYPVSAEAVEECVAIGWHRDTLRDLMHRYPQLALNGIDMIGRRFTQLQERHGELSTQRVEQRVARALLRLVRQFGKRTDEGVLIDLPLTRQDLAEMSGTNLYSVSRFLSKWEQQGFVDTRRKRVMLRQAHQLVLIAEDLLGDNDHR